MAFIVETYSKTGLKANAFNGMKENMKPPTQLDPKFINRKASLPYGFTIDELTRSVSETYRLFNGLNKFLTSSGFRPLEELLLGNSLSGILSEILVKNIATLSNNGKPVSGRFTDNESQEELFIVG